MKRIIALLLAVCLLLALGACGKKETKKDPIQESAEAASQAAAAAQNTAPDQAGEQAAQSEADPAAQTGDAAAADQTPAEPAEEQPETPSYLGDAIAAKTIKVSKNLSKTVYMGIPYALSVTGGIKKVKTSASKIAKGAKDGTLTLKKPGKAKLTITTRKGKKFVLTLTVKDTPAPTSPKVTYKSGKTVLLEYSGELISISDSV